MNTYILSQLAKEESPTLVALANRWMVANKCVDPVGDALLLIKADEEKNEGFSCGFGLGCIGAFLTFVLAIGFLSANEATGICFAVLAVIWSTIYFIFWWRARGLVLMCKNTQGLEAFCSAITTVECLASMVFLPREVVDGLRPISLQKQARIWEQSDALTKIGKIVGYKLKKDAIELKRIQDISWKSAEATNARLELMRKYDTSSALLLNLPGKRELFKNEQAMASAT